MQQQHRMGERNKVTFVDRKQKTLKECDDTAVAWQGQYFTLRPPIRKDSEDSPRTVWSPFPKKKNPWVQNKSELSPSGVRGQSELSVHLQLPWILNSYFFKKVFLIFDLI